MAVIPQIMILVEGVFSIASQYQWQTGLAIVIIYALHTASKLLSLQHPL